MRTFPGLVAKRLCITRNLFKQGRAYLFQRIAGNSLVSFNPTERCNRSFFITTNKKKVVSLSYSTQNQLFLSPATLLEPQMLAD